MSRDLALEKLHAKLATLLERQVEPLFTGDVKLTLLARTPWLEDGGVIVSNDDPEQAIAEIRRLTARPAYGDEPPATPGQGGG